MSISSRSPEGQPLNCPWCGKRPATEVSPVTGDVTCSACGRLLREHRDLVFRWRRAMAELLGVDLEKLKFDATFVNALSGDSLDTVELIMELEEEFDLKIPDEDAQHLKTAVDALRQLIKRCRKLY